MTQLASAVTYTRCLYPALAPDPTTYRLRPPIGGKLYMVESGTSPLPHAEGGNLMIDRLGRGYSITIGIGVTPTLVTRVIH